MKTKFDNGMQMEIPHNINIVNAMYGFRELETEIVPYHEVDDIAYRVDREDIVLDYIDQCNYIYLKFDVVPEIPDYPDLLSEIKVVSHDNNFNGCFLLKQETAVFASSPSFHFNSFLHVIE